MSYTPMKNDHSEDSIRKCKYMHMSLEEIDIQTLSFMHLTECENEPNHACCAYNKCRACLGLEEYDDEV